MPCLNDYEVWLREVTEKLAREQLGQNQDLEIQIHVLHTRAPEGLLAVSVKAELLVVSHSGGRTPGPNVEQCVRNSVCPVLVVRPDPEH